VLLPCCAVLCCHLSQVIKLISRVIADFANGEISQASSLFDTEVTLQRYLDKSFYKTASLIAASCRSSAVFSNMDDSQKEAMYAYGKHLGLAFQVGSKVRLSQSWLCWGGCGGWVEAELRSTHMCIKQQAY
jgi:putative intracellular protease/amidase